MTLKVNEEYLKTDSLFFASLVTPDAIKHAEENLAPVLREIARKIIDTPSPRLYFIGCGASLSAMMGGKYLLDRFTSIPSYAYSGWQFIHRAPRAVTEQAFVFTTSYSGQTPEVQEAKRFALERTATTIAITDNKSTPLAQDADYVLDYQSKAVYTAPLAIMYLLAAYLMQFGNENHKTGNEIIEETHQLPDRLAQLIEESRQGAGELAEQFKGEEGFYVLGTGPLYSLAFKLALSVVIENLWIDGCPIDTGEFYHGPIEIVPPDQEVSQRMAFMHLVGTDSTRTVSKQAIDFCAKHNCRQLIFDAKKTPEFGELFSPFALFVPTEWFILYMSAIKEHDVDERRYMGKIGSHWGDYGNL